MAALESLVERQRDFDYILLETTGVADPGNIAPMFWLDEGLGSSIYLDGIVTVVDAKNILKSLDEPAPEEIPDSEQEQEQEQSRAASHDNNDRRNYHHDTPLLTTAHLQISHADVILLNKTDLVTAAQLSIVQARLSSINGLAKIIPTMRSQIPEGQDLSGTVLDLQAYSTFPTTSSTASTTITDATTKMTTKVTGSMPNFSSKGHSHLDPTISTLTIPLPPFDLQKLPLLQAWLENLLWEADDRQRGQKRKYEIHRTKGLVPLTDDAAVRVIQGVRDIFEIIEVPPPPAPNPDEGEQGGPQDGKIVFIGRNLDLIAPAGADSAEAAQWLKDLDK